MIRGLFRASGLFLLTTLNLNSLENRLKVASGQYLVMTGAYPEDHNGERVRVFNASKIRELCENSGFALEELRGIPTIEPKGRWLDAPLAIAGRFLPSFSKILMAKARKIRPA